jgi:tetratricopeptide (TPR) repeat protein
MCRSFLLARFLAWFVACVLLSVCCLAQQDASSPQTSSSPKNSSAPPGSASRPAEPDTSQESSSRDTRVDTTPPRDDDKNHPYSHDVASDLEAPPASDVQEFHPWNPYKAGKDIQVGDFYFKRGNFKGALERYKDALYYKQGDAVATFRIGECQEKLGNKAEARKYFEQYLKILPEGPLAKTAHASLEKLDKSH